MPVSTSGSQLGAVVAHLGGPGDGIGHYAPFCRRSASWISFSDSSVDFISQPQAGQDKFPEIGASAQDGNVIYWIAEDRLSASKASNKSHRLPIPFSRFHRLIVKIHRHERIPS
jgi:hypothetical protein